MGAFAGLISVIDLAVNTIIMMMIGFMFMIPVGVQSAACAIIGSYIGAN